MLESSSITPSSRLSMDRGRNSFSTVLSSTANHDLNTTGLMRDRGRSCDAEGICASHQLWLYPVFAALKEEDRSRTMSGDQIRLVILRNSYPLEMAGRRACSKRAIS